MALPSEPDMALLVAPPSLYEPKDCVYLRGLPRDADVGTIVKILGRYTFAVRYRGIHAVHDIYDQPTGEAFIEIESEDSAFWAAVHCNGRYMADQTPHYIEAFLCSWTDVLERSTAMLAPSRFDADAPVATPHAAFHPDLPIVPMLSPAQPAALPRFNLRSYASVYVIAAFFPESLAPATHWNPLLVYF